MTALAQLVVFGLNAQRYALPLATVECFVPAVEVTPLPAAPALVLGVINLEGRVLPVLNLRRRCGLPEREIRPTDQMLIANTREHTVVLVVDEALEVVACPASEIVRPEQIVP